MEWYLKKFNELTGEELYKILALRNEVFIVEQNCPYIDCDYKDLKCDHLFCEEEGEIIAYSRIIPRGVSYEEASIGRVIIKSKYRGKGIAREMMIKAVKVIENNFKEDTIKIQAQAHLINFYGSIGFKPISEEYLEDNIPHIDMIYIKI